MKYMVFEKRFFSYLVNSVFFSFLLFFPSCNMNSKNNLVPEKTCVSHLSKGWYPQDKNLLNKQINNFFIFSKDNFDVVVDPQTIMAIIVPHAGYNFSGLCAASVYQNLLENKKTFRKNKKIKKVVILSPSHTKTFNGISLPDYNVYKTCLGNIKVDSKIIDKLKKNLLFAYVNKTHEIEHAIEIQLPFLQKTIENFKIIPLIVGKLQKDQFCEVTKELSKVIDDSTLVVISSDFIHYGKNYNYEPFSKNIFNSIRFVDSMAIQAIIKKSYENFSKVLQKTLATICGQNPIKILLKLFEDKKLDVESRMCCYYTSAQIQKSYKDNNGKIVANKLLQDISDDNINNSVSYLGMLFTTQKLNSLEPKDQLTEYDKKVLSILPRQTLKNSFKKDNKKIKEHLLLPIKSLGLQQQKGAFVTVKTKDGNLKGCIGRIITKQPLFLTVQEMSKAAAFNDTRFKPLKENELKDIVIDISVLTTPHPIKSYKDIKIGKDGIILKNNFRSAVFLPHVSTGFGWDLKETLKHLSRKAGLNQDAWKKDCEFEVFQGFEIHE
ncbi:AmmeMemoRadiSam system protein B [Candidatus Dependentiae bacterium]